MEIRKATNSDYEQIKRVASVMGDSPFPSIKNFDRILSHPDHHLLVAVDKTVVGYLHYQESLRVNVPPFIEIVGLAVSADAQNKGIGSSLIDSLPPQTRVRCKSTRKAAIAFYLANGFEVSKEQTILVKA